MCSFRSDVTDLRHPIPRPLTADRKIPLLYVRIRHVLRIGARYDLAQLTFCPVWIRASDRLKERTPAQHMERIAQAVVAAEGIRGRGIVHGRVIRHHAPRQIGGKKIESITTP